MFQAREPIVMIPLFFLTIFFATILIVSHEELNFFFLTVRIQALTWVILLGSNMENNNE